MSSVPLSNNNHEYNNNNIVDGDCEFFSPLDPLDDSWPNFEEILLSTPAQVIHDDPKDDHLDHINVEQQQLETQENAGTVLDRGLKLMKISTKTRKKKNSIKVINNENAALLVAQSVEEEEGTSSIAKKLDHNAKERIRRMKINASYLALRALLPDSRRSKVQLEPCHAQVVAEVVVLVSLVLPLLYLASSFHVLVYVGIVLSVEIWNFNLVQLEPCHAQVVAEVVVLVSLVLPLLYLASSFHKRMGAPAIVDRVLKYIPEMENEVEELRSKKENVQSAAAAKNKKKIIIDNSSQYQNDHLTVSVNKVNDEEAIVQMCMAKEDHDDQDQDRISAFTNLLKSVEDDEGICIKTASTNYVCDTRICYHLHIQVTSSSIHKLSDYQFNFTENKKT
ncbi:hypothetical protein BUALT_Bualt15G0083300 [Buddleja alternifolia]|uniref:BHLH domain-containing protein n=1 Tax=Buddleja alternifolia TaxID=168488 RepID=A0AAV6WDK0_9LAMI|nr:hypothetical protein BUALT_Bualt15G0083300 [Buddleja alternifolia]